MWKYDVNEENIQYCQWNIKYDIWNMVKKKEMKEDIIEVVYEESMKWRENENENDISKERKQWNIENEMKEKISKGLESIREKNQLENVERRHQ